MLSAAILDPHRCTCAAIHYRFVLMHIYVFVSLYLNWPCWSNPTIGVLCRHAAERCNGRYTRDCIERIPWCCISYRNILGVFRLRAPDSVGRKWNRGAPLNM